MFQISDKVVCVDDGPCRGENRFKGKPCGLHRGTIYVVRGVETCGRSGECVLYLVGINNEICPLQGKEYGYGLLRFRKLSEVRAENAAKRAAEART